MWKLTWGSRVWLALLLLIIALMLREWTKPAPPREPTASEYFEKEKGGLCR